MNHHGLLITPQDKMTSDDMCNVIVSHIALGHCMVPKSNPRPWMLQKTQMIPPLSNDPVDSVQDTICDDFIRDAAL